MGIFGNRQKGIFTSVPLAFEFKPEEEKKERKSPKLRINQETSSEFDLTLNPLISNGLVTPQILSLISQKT